MKENQINIDELFEQARSIKTEISFEETKRSFLTAVLLAAGGVLATKGVLKILTTKKWIIMISAITTITTASLISVMSFSPKVEEGSSTNNFALNPEFKTKELVALVPEEKSNEEAAFDAIQDENQMQNIAIIESENFSDIGDFTIYKELFRDDTIVVNDNNGERQTIIAYDQRFVIDSETTMDDLKQMKEQAEAAGIKFSYKARIKNNYLKGIALKTEIKTKGNHQSISITSNDFKKDDDPIIFSWNEDENGKATEMVYGDQSESKTTIRTDHGNDRNSFEHEFHLDDRAITFAYNVDREIDSMDIEMTDNMEVLLENLEDEIEAVEIQLENRSKTIDLTGVHVILNEVNQESKELFRTIQLELKTIFKEIEVEHEDEKEERE